MRDRDETQGLADPREGYPEEGENPNAFGMREPPQRMELLADLIRETHHIERHASWLERENDRMRDQLRAKRQEKDALADRVVRAEMALVACEEKDSAIDAAVYMETLDDRYIAQLRSDNAEARSL